VDVVFIGPYAQAMSARLDIRQKFGCRVRELRKAKGLSQEAFADKCGLDRTYISGIERGRRNVALRNIEVIARALETTISELMRGL
jgi:transcriptional regulator with XRE-family HTH domain